MKMEVKRSVRPVFAKRFSVFVLRFQYSFGF